MMVWVMELRLQGLSLMCWSEVLQGRMQCSTRWEAAGEVSVFGGKH